MRLKVKCTSESLKSGGYSPKSQRRNLFFAAWLVSNSHFSMGRFGGGTSTGTSSWYVSIGQCWLSFNGLQSVSKPIQYDDYFRFSFFFLTFQFQVGEIYCIWFFESKEKFIWFNCCCLSKNWWQSFFNRISFLKSDLMHWTFIWAA